MFKLKFKLPLAAALLLLASSAQAAPLTIDECLSAAIKNNPDLTAASENINAEKATIGQAESTGRPQLSAGASYSRGGTGLSSSNNSGLYSGTVGVDQNISDWGRRQTKVRGARLLTDAVSMDYHTARADVVMQVYSAYYGLNRSLRDAAIAQTRYDNFQKRLKWAKAYYEVGTKAKIEVTKAESDLAASKLTIVKAQAAAQQYKAALASAMGEPMLPIDEVVDILAYADWKMPIDEAVKTAQARRPELLAKKNRVDYAATNLTLQMKGLSPTLGASAGYTASGSSPADNGEWSSKLSLSVPLTDGGLTKAKTEQARAQLRAAEAEYQSLSNSVTLEVRKAWEALREAKEALVSSLESERSAKATLELAQGRYAAGVGDNLEISDAIDQYATAQTNTVLSLYTCKTAQLDLEKAMGGLKYGD